MIKSKTLHFIDPDQIHLWDEINKKDLTQIANFSESTLDHDSIFTVRMIGADWQVDPEKKLIIGPSERPNPDNRTAITLLYYLTTAKESSLSTNLVTEKGLPGGDRFFSGGHALKKQPLINRFGRNGKTLIQAATKIGATSMEEGPHLYRFWISLLPKVPVQISLSIADDEFEADINFSFDSASADHCPLPIISTLINLLTELLIKRVSLN